MTAAIAAPSSGLREIAVFGVISLALHAGLFLQFSGGGTDGAGDGGASAVTIAAADATLAALVAEWDQAPDAATAAPSPQPAPSSVEATLRTPDADRAAANIQPPALPLPDAPSVAPRHIASAPQPPESPPESPADEVPQAAAPLPDTRPVPRPEPANTSAAAAQQPAAAHRASGAGEAATAGQQANGTGATLSPQRHAALQAEWAGAIQSRIARHQRYPSGNHGDGRVKVELVILRSGKLGQVTLAASSGRPALDDAALTAVRRAAPFPPAPDGLEDDWYRVAQWMSFRR
jgi:periplasmic protein TonB